MIKKWFGDWKAIGPKPETTLPPVPLNKPSAANVPDPEAIQDSVDLSEQLELNRFDPDYYPLQLGNHVLGGGFYATRLYHDLRQVAGYVYNVDVSLNATKTRASYSVTYGCDPQNVSKARALIQRDLHQMRTVDVPADELHQAKALLLRQIPLSESSEDAVAEGFLRRAEIGLPLDEPVRAAEVYSKLSAAEVRQLSREKYASLTLFRWSADRLRNSKNEAGYPSWVHQVRAPPLGNNLGYSHPDVAGASRSRVPILRPGARVG